MSTTATKPFTSRHHPTPPPPITDSEIIQLAAQFHHHSSHFSLSQPSQQPTLPPFLLSSSSHPTLLSYLNSRSNSPNPSSAVSEYVCSLLTLSTFHPSLTSLIPALALSYTTLFTSGKIPHDRFSLSSLQLFSTHLDDVTPQDLPPIVDSIISYLPQITDSEDAQILILLPTCLELIRKSNEVEKGGQYANSVVDKILDFDWNKVMLMKMVETIRDYLYIDRARRTEFLKKVFSGMRKVEIQDLPGLVYQLLVLASKGFSKREVIEGIVMYFGGRTGAKSGSTLRQVEGTVLLHVNFAVKQDPSLGQEVLGLVKVDSRVFNHFSVAVLLSIARVKRFRESAIGVLRSALFSAYKDYKFAKTCKWLPEKLKEDYLQHGRLIEKAVLRAVSESNYGREHILPSIVRLGFGLLEGAEGKHFKECRQSDGLMGAEELGSEVLKGVFQGQEMARNEIIEQCKFRILSSKLEVGLPIIRLLGCLVQSQPYLMLDRVSHLKELLDYFTYMNAKISSSLITVLLPLIKVSGDLQDYTILVLRKAMFRREASVRFSATTGIIDLILAEKECKRDGPFSFQESSSQASCSQQVELYNSNRGGLFQELSGLLQRCLYQQANVREILYSGLVKIVLMDPLAAGGVLDFLLPHFLQFYREDAEVQLGISQCIKVESSKACTEEPLDCLLSCICWIFLLQPHGKPDQPSDSWACLGFSLTQENEAGRTLSVEKLSNCLVKIRKMLRTNKLEGLLGTDQASSTSTDKEKRKCCAFVLSGIIEVLSNTILFELEKATEVKKVELEEELSDLIGLYESLEESTNCLRKGTVRASAHTASEKGDTGRTKPCHERSPFLATSSIHQLLQTAMYVGKLVPHRGAADPQNHSQVSNNNDSVQCSKILSFALKICLCQLELLPLEDKNDPLKTLLFGKITTLAPPLLRLVLLLKSRPKPEMMDQRKKEGKGRKDIDKREHIHMALVCLKKLIAFSLCSSDYADMIETLLSVSELEYISGNVENGDWDCLGTDVETAEGKELFIRKILSPLLTEFLALSFFSEVEVLCDIIGMVGNTLPRVRMNLVGEWANCICKSTVILNPKVVKSIVSLVLSLSSPPNDLTIAGDMAAELLKVVETEKTEPLAKSESYPTINKSTYDVVTASLLQSVESVIVDMDWITVQLKSYCTSSQRGNSLDQNDKVSPAVKLEETLYSRITAVLKVLASLVNINLKDPHAEQFLRLATKLYKNLAQISKLRIAPRGFKQILPSLKYQKLVEITCRQLTAPLYSFVANLQQNQDSRPTKGLVSKIKRENKCIPELIFHIEDYEKYLIQLSKATKLNLLRHAKRSTARDFKIILENDYAVDEEAPNPETVENVVSASEHESSEDSEVRSPEPGSPLAAEGSGSEGENEAEASIPNAKRARSSRDVEDSDDETEEALSLAF